MFTKTILIHHAIAPVETSPGIAEAITDYKTTLQNIKDENKKTLKRFNWIGGLTAFAVFIGVVALVCTTWSLLSSSFDKVNEASEIINDLKQENRLLRNKLVMSDTLTRQLSDLKIENKQIRKVLRFNSKKISTLIQHIDDGSKTNHKIP